MKNFSEITKDELLYLKSHPVEVRELLDMIRFTVKVGNDKSFSVLNSKGRPIGKSDCIVNSVNKEILDFAERFNPASHVEFYEAFGGCIIGFFYLPVNKTKQITYSSYSRPVFILSDFYTNDKSLNNISDLLSYVGECGFGNFSVSGYPIIKTFDCLPDSILPDDTNYNIIKSLCGESTFSGNNIDDIEGVVISSGKLRFIVRLNDSSSEIERSTKLIYRDVIIEDFIKVITDEDLRNAVSSKSDYCDRIQELFLSYINKTDIFSTTVFEPEDLLPPMCGYFGDVSYEYLNSTVGFVCKRNELYKNILRILLISFDGKNKKKFYRFPEAKKNRFENISSFLNS